MVVYGHTPVLWSFTAQLLLCGICVSKKKIPFPRQISREGTDEKHMSFFVWPYGSLQTLCQPCADKSGIAYTFPVTLG